MNLVLVLIDSLNRHMLGAYGGGAVATPNLDGFARRAWRFENHFVGSLPCMPARREIYAGIREVMWRPWGPLEPFDERLPRLLADRGYATGLVTDHYHYWEETANGYIQAFDSAEFVRGHETDYAQPPLPAGAPVPRWVENIEVWRPGSGRRYYANVSGFRDEQDYFPAKVMTAAARWLKARPVGTPFFLQVESFDVHEPFDVPEPYASMYGTAGERDRFTVWPPYQDPDQLAAFMAQTSTDELAFIRSQYAGKVTMVDRWFGELLAAVDREALWDDTLILVTTDHGHDLGQRGVFGKQYPHWDSHANIPLFAWHPRHPGEGRSIAALTSTVDLFATLLEAGGGKLPDRTHSRSLLPLVASERVDHRPALLYGTFGQGICCTDGEWTLFKSPVGDGPLLSYSSLLRSSPSHGLLLDRFLSPTGSGRFIPGVPLPQWRMPVEGRVLSRDDFLFNRAADPQQTENLWETEPDQRRRMLDLLRSLLAEEGAPSEQYDRLGLSV